MSSIDDELNRIAAATDSLEPSAAFEDRVLAAVAAEPIRLDFWRTGRIAVVGFAIAAAACVVMALQARSSLDDTVMANLDPVELQE